MPTRLNRPILSAIGLISVLSLQAMAQLAPNAVRLSSQPVRIEALGLTLFLPEGAGAQNVTQGQAGSVATQVVFPDASGFTAIHGKRSRDEALTLTGVTDELAEKMLTAAGKINAQGKLIEGTSRANIIERDPDLTINGFPADRFYVEFPQVGRETPEVRGYTVFKTGPGRFVIFELFTDLLKLDKARVNYETMISSAEFTAGEDIDIKRSTMVRAGVGALASLTPADYRDVMNNSGQRWERLYSPARTGDDLDAREHGYRRLRAWVGRRGELNPIRPESEWSDLEREPGFLLRIDALLLENDLRVDSQAIYFLSVDRTRESWTVKMSLREGDAPPNRWEETGAREDTSMVVRVEQNASPPRVIKPLAQTEGYISVLESYMMGPLLVKAGVPADFAFYAYQSQGEKVSMRTDSVKRPQGADGPFEITTRPREDGPSQTARYRPDGSLIRIERPDGRIWEPIEFDRLVALWRAKGLPLE